jgi:hypothetical protein
MGLFSGDWALALQTVGMVVVLPVALGLCWDASKRGMAHRWLWIAAWAVTTLAISLLVGVVVVAIYLVRRPPRQAARRSRAT